MNAKKQISLEQLFRLYPQLRQASHPEGAHAQGGEGGAPDEAVNVSAGRTGELAEV